MSGKERNHGVGLSCTESESGLYLGESNGQDLTRPRSTESELQILQRGLRR
ncbi:unnamed protein product [Penicillium salamii]|nr:unnamed protein product [Penicillium salamii]